MVGLNQNKSNHISFVQSKFASGHEEDTAGIEYHKECWRQLGTERKQAVTKILKDKLRYAVLHA